VKKLFFIFLLYISLPLLCLPTQLIFTPPFTITGLINETTFFIQDALQNNFVLKYHPRGPKRAIHDALGAFIGASIGININEVEVFPAQYQFITTSQTGVATLHICVPGTAIREIKKMDGKICIKRGIRKEKTLNNIAAYKELCDIVAFDIFIDNTDRHNGNIFFDKKTGHFYAIDMDHGFKSAFTLPYTPHEYDFSTVATRTYRFIKTLKKEDLSRQEIKALKRVQQTLQRLVILYPPVRLFEEWMLLAQKAHIIYNQREQAKIKKYLAFNDYTIQELISLLNETIQNQIARPYIYHNAQSLQAYFSTKPIALLLEKTAK
jgi:hypothetical protein